MFKKSIKKIRNLTILFCILMIMFGSAFSTMALNFEGTGGGSGGGSQAGKGGFLITWDDRVTGYRFSIVNASGNKKMGTETINIFPDAASWKHGSFTYRDYTMTTGLCNKLDVIRNFGKRGTTSAPKNCYRAYSTDDGLYNMKLPTALNGLAGNLKKALDKNAANACLKKMGCKNGFSNLQQGDNVLVEPFFSVRIANERMNLTVSEMAWVASSVCKYKQDDIPKGSGTSGTFGFICDFTNGVWPRALYVDKAVPNYWSAVNPQEAHITGTTAQKRNKLKFSSIVRQGYGVALLWEDVPRETNVDLAITDISFLDSAKKKIDKLQETKEVYLAYTVKNYSGYTVKCKVNSNMNSTGKNGKGWTKNYTRTITLQPQQSATFYADDRPKAFNKTDFALHDFSYGTEDFKIRGSAQIDVNSITVNNAKGKDTNSSNNARNTSINYYIFNPVPSIVVNAEDGTPKIVDKVYSGQRFSSYASIKNNSWFNARFDSSFKRTYRGITHEEVVNNKYAASSLYWNIPLAMFRPKYTNTTGIAYLTLHTQAEEITSRGQVPIKGTAEKRLNVYPTDLAVQNIELVSVGGQTVFNKAVVNQEMQFRYTFINNTKLPVKVSWNVEYDNAGGFQMDYTETIPALSSHTVYSKPFQVTADKTEIEAKASIYLFDLWGNTEYEYDGRNNTLTKAFDIVSPFTPTLKNDQKSVAYRKGTTVYTSFYIKNNSQMDISSLTHLNGSSSAVGQNPTATISVYRDEKKTQLISTTDMEFCIPRGNEPTLVWIRWDIPIDCPDTVYIECSCDSKDVFSCSEFVDNKFMNGAFNAKNITCAVNTKQPIIANTPDTDFTKTTPSWLSRTHGSGGVSPNVSLNENLYAKAADMRENTSWSYFVVINNGLVKKTDSLNIDTSYTNITPAGSPSAKTIDKNNIEIKSGYGFMLNSDITLNCSSTDYTYAQNAYTIFPEFMYMATSDDKTNAISNVLTNKKITNYVTPESGFKPVQRAGTMLSPKSGGSYATYATLVKGENGFELPINDSVNDHVHFTPIWYPNGHYKTYTYFGDIWCPGGMISGLSTSNVLTINGNMYEDYVVAEWQGSH